MTNKDGISVEDRLRFESRFTRGGDDECWEWVGGLTAGYGSFGLNSKTYRATHIALALVGKPRPSKSHFACHRCDNPPCVNPAHLWWGTAYENAVDASRKGRIPLAARTHCPKGHPFSGDNLVIPEKGGRECLECRRVTGKERARRGRERKANGQMPRFRRYNAKLTEAQVIEIRAQKGVVTTEALARQYGVSASCIHSLLHGITYRKVS